MVHSAIVNEIESTKLNKLKHFCMFYEQDIIITKNISQGMKLCFHTTF